MNKVHLAPYGHMYAEDANGKFLITQVVHEADAALCGSPLPMTRDGKNWTRDVVRTVLAHDHQEACSFCVGRLATRPTDRVQPVLLLRS